MTEPTPLVRKMGTTLLVSVDTAMDWGLIPDTRPALPPPSRRERIRRWRLAHLTRYALRAALSHAIDPDPYKNDRDCSC